MQTPDDPVTQRQRRLGQQLAEWRKIADLNQTKLARQVSYDRTTVAHAERGTQLPAEEFWLACDRVLATDGALLRSYHAVKEARQRKAEEAAARARAERRRRLAGTVAEAASAGPHRVGSVTDLGTLDARQHTLMPSAERDGILEERSFPTSDVLPTATSLLPVMTSFDQLLEGSGLDAIPRRAFLAGIATASAAASTSSAGHGLSSGLASSSAVTARSAMSWAVPVLESVVHPTDAARQAMSELESDYRCDSLSDLRRAADGVTQASFSSDYVRLGRSLPRLIGRAEAASITGLGGGQAGLLHVLSDIYAVAGWTLIKADLPAGAWIAAQRAVQTRIRE